MTSARHGGVLGKLLVILVVVSLAGALGFTTLANHRAHGVWSFHPLDPAWWSPKAATGPDGKPAADPFADVANDAQRLAGRAGEALWGKDGLVERCESWWRSREATTAPSPVAPTPTPTPTPTPPTTNPAAPATPAPAAPTSVRGLLEQRLFASEQRFAQGIDLAKKARPALGDDATALAARMGSLSQARTCFAEVERDLGEAIPAYEALPGHDPARAASARQLLGFTKQMQELTRLTP
jgi:hypothetical protein